jgi:hypothetical protein
MKGKSLILAALLSLVLAAPAAAESPFTMYVTPEATTGTQTMTQWGYVPFEDNANSLYIEVRLVPTYSGCSTTHYTTISTTTFTAPNEKGWFTLCGVLWGSSVYNDVCSKKSECYIIAESTASFDVTATTGELKAQKEAKEAEEAEAKAAKEAQAKWEREATEAKVAAETKEAQERAARVEAETKAHEVQRAEREATERAILNPLTIAPLATTKTTVTPTPTHPLVQSLNSCTEASKGHSQLQEALQAQQEEAPQVRKAGQEDIDPSSNHIIGEMPSWRRTLPPGV